MVLPTIRDAVLGDCPLTPLCGLFAGQPEHVRLRHIVMSHADVMYPSVTYTRREHCLSVMHLARRWAMRLTTDSRLVDLIALAGLYHDVGHVTTSHALDDYLSSCGVVDHETRSVHTLKAVNARIVCLSDVEERFVAHAITGTVGHEFPLWAYRVVHQTNRRLPDVDRITYLINDARRLGFPCLFDPVRIENNISVVDGDLHFATPCHTDLDQIITMRRIHFETVFQHPVVVEYQQRLVRTFLERFGKDRLLSMFESEAWLNLTDVMLWGQIPEHLFV